MCARRLTALEATFVALESPDVPFVHASILELDRPVPLDALRALVAAAVVPGSRFRQRIVASLEWSDDEDFRVERHVAAIRVAAPGGASELDALAAELLERALPEEHPPWQLWAVEGVANGRGAVIACVHHALVDGVAGLHALEELLAGRTLGPAPAAPRGPLAKVVTWRNARALARQLRLGVSPANAIGLNPRHTHRRRAVASHTFELAAAREVGRAFGATVNDVALAVVTGALRRYLARRGIDPDRLRDVRAMVPVARYAADEHAIAGNKVTLLLAPLPVRIHDPREQLRAVVAATRRDKTDRSAGGGDLLVALGDATTSSVLAGVLRIALALRAFNVLITNVPGPKTALELAGARLERIVPIVNLWPHQALAIAIASYAGMLTFGVQADRAVVPDVAAFRDDLVAAFDALRAAGEHDVRQWAH